MTKPAQAPAAAAATPAQAKKAGAGTAAAPAAGTPCTEGCPSTVKIVIKVQRKYNYHDKGTPGTLEAGIEGQAPAVTGFTTEQPPGTRNLGHGAGSKAYPIAAGTYKAYVREGSSRNGKLKAPYTHDAVQLIDVKGTDGKSFAGVQIHTGQFPKHSEGCIILAGSSNGDENIANFNLMGDSVPKNEELLEFIDKTKKKHGAANVSIEVVVKDPPSGATPPPLPPPKKK